MTEKEFRALRPGDIVRHQGAKGHVWIVTGNYGGRVTAVGSVDLTNPEEWDLLEHIFDKDGGDGETLGGG